MTTWIELAALPEGSRLRFKEPHDCFPDCFVPAGTTCTLKDNDLNEIWSAMMLLPDDENLRAKLIEWEGCIIIGGPEKVEQDKHWYGEAPFEVMEVET